MNDDDEAASKAKHFTFGDNNPYQQRERATLMQ
jgi:hypothetical protein